MKIVIPARKGSKGLPFKNRKLLNDTLNIIPDELKSSAYVLSDDHQILNDAANKGFMAVVRSDSSATDEASTKEAMQEFVNSYCDEKGEFIVMLYLTYPERTWDDVKRALNFYSSLAEDADSMLCKKELKTSPFLMLKSERGHRGSQLFYHDLYRRQDYPECFEISHYICIFNSLSINNLNNNMYNISTVFMEISDVTDVDTQKDLDEFNGKI